MRLFTALRNRLFGPPADSDLFRPSEEDAVHDAPVEAADVEPSSVDASTDAPAGEAEPGPLAGVAMPEPEQPADAEDTASVVAARQERAAARILDDERLRGALTDDEFQPLLDWALSSSDSLAASTAGQDDEAAEQTIGTGLDAITEIVEEAGRVVHAHAEGDAEGVESGLAFIGTRWSTPATAPIDAAVPGDLYSRLESLADRLVSEPDLSGADVAAAIVTALTGPTPDTAGDADRATTDGELEGLS